MSTLTMILTAAVLAFAAAWGINALMGLLSGDRPEDTRSVFLEMFLRVLGVLEFGFLGRLLDATGSARWVRWFIYFGAALFLVRVLGDWYVHW